MSFAGEACAAIMAMLHEIRPFETRGQQVYAVESYTGPLCVLVQLRGDVMQEEAEEAGRRAFERLPCGMRVTVEVAHPVPLTLDTVRAALSTSPTQGWRDITVSHDLWFTAVELFESKMLVLGAFIIENPLRGVLRPHVNPKLLSGTWHLGGFTPSASSRRA